jgi:hypothetical protein
MVGPSGMRYEVTIWQCIQNFFLGLAGQRASYGARNYSQWYDAGWKISCGFFLAVITSPLWGSGMLIGFLIGRYL